jgi:hypothetical protein
MKKSLKVSLSAIGVAALLASPATAQSITSLRAVPAAGNNVFQNLGHGLQVATVCHDGIQGPVQIRLQNLGPGNATVNWFFSDGTTVNASGLAMRPPPEPDEALFDFKNKRLEGQFIFANSAGDTTVNLHAFDGGAFCEIQGTAQFGPNP